MRQPLLVRVVVGMAFAVPVTLLGTSAAIAVGTSIALASLIGGGMGAIGGLLATKAVESEDEHHE